MILYYQLHNRFSSGCLFAQKLLELNWIPKRYVPTLGSFPCFPTKKNWTHLSVVNIFQWHPIGTKDHCVNFIQLRPVFNDVMSGSTCGQLTWIILPVRTYMQDPTPSTGEKGNWVTTLQHIDRLKLDGNEYVWYFVPSNANGYIFEAGGELNWTYICIQLHR